MCLLLRKQLDLSLLNLVWQKQNSIQKLYSVASNEINVPLKKKGRFASIEQKRIISEFIVEANSKKIDWNALKLSVLSLNRGYINEKNISGCILEQCCLEKRLDLAKSYMKYVKESGQTKPNLSLELLYLRSCYVSRNQLTDDDRHEIQAICQVLFKNYSNLINSFILEGNVNNFKIIVFQFILILIYLL